MLLSNRLTLCYPTILTPVPRFSLHDPCSTPHSRPQAFIRTGTTTVDVILPDNVEMAMPGDSVKTTMKMDKPYPLQEGLRFALREGGITVASGIVTKCGA